MPELVLSYPDYTYRFDLLLAVLSRFAHPARQVIQDGQLWRVTQGHVVCYRQCEDGIHIEFPDSNNPEALTKASKHILGFDIDLTDFYTFARADDVLWRVIQPLHGLPIFRTETVFEALITLIIEQHIAWKNALRSQKSLMQTFETGHTVEDVTVYDFPSPLQLAETIADDLKPLKITNRRIDMMIQLAKDVVSGDFDIDTIDAMDTPAAYKHLLKIKGVGHWTANNVISRALGRFPYISHNDVALQAAVLHYFYDDVGKKSAQQVIDTLEPYGEYAGLVGHFTLLRWVLDKYPVIT